MATTPRKTFPELQALSAPVADSDVLAVYRTPGPAKRTTASVFSDYIKAFFSASTGAGLVGSRQTGTDSVARTQQDRLEDYVSVMDFIPVSEHAAIRAGTSTLNVASYITAALAAHSDIFMPAGQYTVNTTIAVPTGKNLRGVGYATKIVANSVSGAVISVTGAFNENPKTVGGFRITGTSTTGVVVDGGLLMKMDNISLNGLTCTNGFYFKNTFTCQYSNLWTNGATISNACFIVGQAFNANDCRNWYTSNRSTYSFYLDGSYDGGNGTTHASTFSMMCFQSTKYGIWLGNCQGMTFNGVYFEDLAIPFTIGDYANSKLVRGLVINGGDFAACGNTHPQFADRIAVFELDYVSGLTVTGGDLSGAFNCAGAAPLTITGDGSGAFAVARVTPAGLVHSVEVITAGSGYTTATVTAGGAGLGATFSVSFSSGGISAVAVTAAGTGYVAVGCPVAIRYNRAFKCSFNGMMFNSGGIANGDSAPLYPWLVYKTGANSGSTVKIDHDTSWRNAGNNNSAFLLKTRSFNYTFALVEYDNLGVSQNYVYSAPVYP